MMKLTVLQGVPGSGKSTTARIISELTGAVICSTDDYFIENGVYKFDESKLSEFHKKNFERACCLMLEGNSVIIDNTNILLRSCLKYCEFAMKLGFEVEFIRCTGNYQNVHGVSGEKVEKMRLQMEKLSIESLFGNSICS